MQYFIRSLRYLWPYRARMAAAVACVLVIAALWSGSLGMVLPGARILLSPEGLHGWAYQDLANDRMGVKLVQQETPVGTTMVGSDGREIEIEQAMCVTAVDPAKAAANAGIGNADWVVGIVDDNAEHYRMRADALVRELSRVETGQSVTLNVLSVRSQQPRPVPITMGQAGFTTRILGEVASRLPEPKSYADRFTLFVWLMVGVLAVTMLRGLFTFFQEYLVGTAVWRGIMDLRCQNYNAVLHLPTTFFSSKGVTDATSRFLADMGDLARGQNTLLGKTLVEPAKAIGCCALALTLSWKLTLLAALAGPPVFWLIRKLGKSMHKAARRALESSSGILAVLDETLQGIRIVKAYTMEGSERRRFFRVNRKLYKQQSKMEALDAIIGPSIEMLGILSGMLAAGVAGHMVFRGDMRPDIFLTWMVAMFAIYDPVRKLAKVTLRFQQSDAAAKRIFELQDAPQETFVPSAPSLARHHESIVFDKVTYRYPGGSQIEALRNINLRIGAGQTAAIVGPNGSGKTTLLSLLPRLIDPSQGRVLIDGVDISQCSIRSLRRQIGLVSQDSVLFHATIRDNIAYGLRRPHEEAVMMAARKAFVDEFVREMPQGYDTMVGEHGTTLSGGQRQRIAIARAILRDPAIMIFDEAMSQVDADSERRIHEAMLDFTKGRTTLTIAHRFATVMSADQIVVMDNGQIVDTGTHGQLVDRCELYRHLYQTQFADTAGASDGQAKAKATPVIG